VTIDAAASLLPKVIVPLRIRVTPEPSAERVEKFEKNKEEPGWRRV
jgi:hypothetical protein